MLALPPKLFHRYSISSEWKKDIKPIASHYCGAWLQTEYNTATLRAKFAAEWKQYEADADIFPNLRWMPTTSATPEEKHKGYWMNRLILPVGDKFWDKHHPGDLWNCKCSLEQTDEPANPDVLSHIPDVKPQKGLAANPGKTGEMFDKTHPYYPKDCSKCWAKTKGKLKNVFPDLFNQKENCLNCMFINDCIEGRLHHQNNAIAHVKEYNKSVHPYDGEIITNKSFDTGELRVLRRSLVDVYEHSKEDMNVMQWLQTYSRNSFEGWKHEGWAEVRHAKHKETEYFNYYSLEINGKTYWANVKMHRYFHGEVLYTIEDECPKDIIYGKHP